MAILSMTIEQRGAGAATAAARRNALRNAFAYIAGLWDKLFKMRRFQAGATARYSLAPRMGDRGSGRKFKGSYVEAKIRRRVNGDGKRASGENKPFVWSGDSRDRVRQQHKIVAKAASHTRAYAENIFDVPTFNLTPKGGRIKLREEFERVIEEERRLLEDLGAQHYENNLARTPPRFTRVA